MYIHFEGSPFLLAPRMFGDDPANLPFALRFYGEPGKSALIFFSMPVFEEGRGKPGLMFLLVRSSWAPLTAAPIPAFDAYEGIFDISYPVGVPF